MKKNYICPTILISEIKTSHHLCQASATHSVGGDTEMEYGGYQDGEGENEADSRMFWDD